MDQLIPLRSPLISDIHADLYAIYHRIATHGAEIVLAAATLVLGYIFYHATATIFRRLLLRSRVQDAFARLLIDNVYKALIFVLTIIVAAGQLGANITAPLAGLGILGIAIGFAAQDSLSNVIAGFLIFFDKPFRVRDYVTIGGNYGRVEQITMRSTRIRTQDNKYVVIPNQKIINEILIDHSTNGDTRILVPVGITYEASIDEARSAIVSALTSIEGVLAKPAPDVVVDALAESSVNLIARFWIPNAADERKYHFLATEAVKRALDAASVEIAYPHIQVIAKK
jgi:small conductance mechanosensitive channel